MRVKGTDHADVRIAPPVLLLLHILAAFLLRSFLPLPIGFPPILVWAGWLLILIGLALGFGSAGQFMRANTSLDPHSPVSAVVTRGPYRFSRNPIYLGFICLLIGFPLAFSSFWGLILSPVLILSLNILVIKHEEDYLQRKFGEMYTSYKARVRRWL